MKNDRSRRKVRRPSPIPEAQPSTGERPALRASRRRDTPCAIVEPQEPRPDRATLTILAGPEAGATFAIDKTETILGRSPRATVPLDETSVSRRHARVVQDDDGRFHVHDLGSTNGTFVSGRRVKLSPLESGDRIQVGRTCVLRFAIVDAIEDAMQRRLYETASRDTLTGLPNRRTFLDRLTIDVANAHASGNELALLMVDLDHFKRVNDTFGHIAGDQVLRAVALAGGKALREGDVLARYGGEELAALARGLDANAAVAIAERFRRAIADVRVEVGGGAIGVTVSVGVALLSACAASADGLDLVALADRRLYDAKRGGRNRVSAEGG